MKIKKFHVLLMLALCATLILVWYAPNDAGDGVAFAKHSAPDRSVRPAVAVAPTGAYMEASKRYVEVLAIHARADDSEKELSLFQPRVIDTKPLLKQHVTPSIPPAPPQAPSLPFRSTGRYSDGVVDVFFLQQGTQNIAVRIDDVIDQTYKVERFDGNVLSFRYIPLNQLQTLELGIAN